MTFVNLVTPKAGAKHELLFNKPATCPREVFLVASKAEAYPSEALLRCPTLGQAPGLTCKVRLERLPRSNTRAHS